MVKPFTHYLLIAGVIGAAITITSQQYPSLPNLNAAPKKLSKEELEALKHSKKFKDFKLQEDEIQELRHDLKLHQLKHPNTKTVSMRAFTAHGKHRPITHWWIISANWI